MFINEIILDSHFQGFQRDRESPRDVKGGRMIEKEMRGEGMIEEEMREAWE